MFTSDPEKRVATHLDNQFRLLREDMLGELREDLDAARGKQRRYRNSPHLKGLAFYGVNCGTSRRQRPATVAFICDQGLPHLPNFKKEDRKKYYMNHKTLLKHQSFGCLLCSNEIIAFATVERNEDLLSEQPPIVLLQIFGESALKKTLITSKTAHKDQLEFILVNTAYFAYEPILKCLQSTNSLPLSGELMDLLESDRVVRSPIAPEQIVTHIQRNQGQNLRHVLNLPKDVILDHSQTASLVAGLSKTVSLIQGPPGKVTHFVFTALECTG